MGLDAFEGVDVGTMFNYPEQAIFCVPRDFPAPTGRTYSEWQALVPSAMRDLIMASNGRALLLFTSKSQMKRVYEAVAPLVPFRCLKQGDAPVPVLTREFRDDTHSVLFATRSFMTGIDVQGESLSLVVLDKLVFDALEDPVFEAESELIESRGGSAFNELSMPNMLLVVEQAAGRLIRTQEDRGAFVLLDSRVLSKSYGSKVRRALPPMTFVDSLTAVGHFFGPKAPDVDDTFDEDAIESPPSAPMGGYDEPF
jgi:ATP-dependent DNA helicase DinG